jgi:predicted dienelactone hydrolase
MKNKIFAFLIPLTIGLTFSACAPPQMQTSASSTDIVEPTYTPLVTATLPTSTPTIPISTQESVSFPLSEPGPYNVGKREFTIVDENRNNRMVQITIWYPALKQTEGSLTMTDREPDLSGAPYPLILTEIISAKNIIRSHLASYGFVMAEIEGPGYFDKWDFQTIDWPLDFLLALDQITSNPPDRLVGVIDATHTGILTFGGQISLALSGARIDPGYYLSYCEQLPTLQPPIESWYSYLACDLAKKWDAFAAHAGDEITTSDDGLWQPLTDERIRAVMPMVADGAWLFGEQGLTTVDRPVLLIQASKDSPYQMTEAAFIFEHIGTPERYMISFIGQNQASMLDGNSKEGIKHFATAYFGFYLQEREDYADFFSEEFVAQFGNLAWGVYPNE